MRRAVSFVGIKRRITLAADVNHGPRGGHKSRLADVVAFFFFLDDPQNELRQLLVGRAAPHQLMQIVIPAGE